MYVCMCAWLMANAFCVGCTSSVIKMYMWFVWLFNMATRNFIDGCDQQAGPARCTCTSSMSSSSTLIYFHGHFYSFRFLRHRSFVSFTARSFWFCSLFYCIANAYWEYDDVQEFFHVTGNYNQLNQFPVLKKQANKICTTHTAEHNTAQQYKHKHI